ncbi:MAG: alpha/beta fold hydrolase [Candidatus Marinimicrobia bacterium]|jgi:esterase|nr:alpha/beta fold hydrolase [Candidatus Neomarinimicrobiota bacterium]MBT4360238.1 alpha/beta fold hydrolase [Candidatus Neomarinimicrobiota bacterium]MBT4715380.1 alpha/beta fold hydrolase [Candidatus Neomarinimicrobiota bacterium]MBT4946826.1 alpha/beta fold hydrolase [Candidatus Neomarinimicrobiota bacterium]MBT5270231.1 alpha/beta fold hydrolase [Candidatus Neomarinimicrobiota bacterium]
MRLHYRRYGAGEPLIILHGLFGSSDNWHTLARRWGQSFQVFTLDQRNHGSSPHESAMNYAELTQDLHQFIKQERLEAIHIVGHSMGGKVGMRFASTHSDLVKSLTVLDIGLDRVEGKHEIILKAVSAINPDEFSSRDEIKRELQNLIESPPVQQFLLKNILRRLDGSFAWKFNREALLEHYSDLTMDLDLDQSFLGAVLFLRGENSDYLEAALPTEILQYFPLARLQTIEGAGHWLHADKPDVLSTLVMDFIS